MLRYVFAGALALGTVAVAAPVQNALQTAIAAPSRTPANVLRDKYRHPYETLTFFGVKPTSKVVEIWPSGGWYTEILAPYVAAKGTYYAAAMGPKGNDGIRKLMAADPARYGKVQLASFPSWDAADTRVPDGSADVVLTFRNVHNWQMGYQRQGQAYAADAFAQAFKMLRKGGVLGVVDHRLPENADIAREKNSGYVKVSTVRALAEAAGFKFVAASEINANPKDTKDYEKGVWTLPPVLTLKDVDRDKYLAIGESDRMTLKFVKP